MYAKRGQPTENDRLAPLTILCDSIVEGTPSHSDTTQKMDVNQDVLSHFDLF